jgi:hypothetical protein
MTEVRDVDPHFRFGIEQPRLRPGGARRQRFRRREGVTETDFVECALQDHEVVPQPAVRDTLGIRSCRGAQLHANVTLTYIGGIARSHHAGGWIRRAIPPRSDRLTTG